MQIIQELVKAYFYYKDGFLYWKFKKCPQVSIGDPAGGIKRDKRNGRDKFSHVTRIDGKPFYTSRLIFLYHYGWMPTVVDYRDRNPLNNKVENLRAADNYKNARNKTSARGSSSKFLGVHRNGRKWAAVIHVEGKNRYIGLFADENEAAIAYNNAAKIHFKEFANLNIIN